MQANSSTKAPRGHPRFLIALILLLSAVAALLPVTSASASPCRYVLGFHALHDAIPDTVGDCLVNEHYNPLNGDALQETARGLLVWRKADNFTAFTDGYKTLVNGPYGIQQRLNTERFSWEKDPQQAPYIVRQYPQNEGGQIEEVTQWSDGRYTVRVVASSPATPQRSSIPCALVPYLAPKGTAEDIAALINSFSTGKLVQVPARTFSPEQVEMILNCTGPPPAASGSVITAGTVSSSGVRANLTRVGSDLYKDTWSGVYVRTFACYEYVYYQDAIVLPDQVIFLTSLASSCSLALR